MINPSDIVELKDGSKNGGLVLGTSMRTTPVGTDTHVLVLWPDGSAHDYVANDLVLSGLPMSVKAAMGYGSKGGRVTAYVAPNGAIGQVIAPMPSPLSHPDIVAQGHCGCLGNEFRCNPCLHRMIKDREPKCECGAHKTPNSNCHADWCKISPHYRARPVA